MPAAAYGDQTVGVWVYVIDFQAHCAGVTNMFPLYNLSHNGEYISLMLAHEI